MCVCGTCGTNRWCSERNVLRYTRREVTGYFSSYTCGPKCKHGRTNQETTEIFEEDTIIGAVKSVGPQ